MADVHSGNGHHATNSPTTLRLKVGLAEMLKGGVIMDVTNACLLYTSRCV